MDKRKFSRVNIEIECLVEKNGRTYEGHVSNLSLKGMMFEPEIRDFEAGERVNISIQLTGHSSSLQIDVLGDVIRADEEGVAINFVELDVDSFIHLKNTIAYNDGDPDKIEREFHDFIKQRMREQREE